MIDPVASQEELIASDNLLTSLPREMLWMFVISVIDVRNNKLTALPTELYRMVRDLGLVRSCPAIVFLLQRVLPENNNNNNNSQPSPRCSAMATHCSGRYQNT